MTENSEQSQTPLSSNSKLYAERDHYALSPHFERHMLALTGERLESKSAIAAELAHRDAEIERLTKALKIAELKASGSLANNLCPDHRDKQTGKPCLACENERLTARVAELQQFHDWAEPQIHDHGGDVLTIERLTRELKRERALEEDISQFRVDGGEKLLAERDRLKAALLELLACKALRERIDGELSACHQEMSPQLQAMENEYQLRKPLAWRDARAALNGDRIPARTMSDADVDRVYGAAAVKRAYYETHEPPHCPTCGCGSAHETSAIPAQETRRQAFEAWWKTIWVDGNDRSSPAFDEQMKKWSHDAWRAGADYERRREAATRSSEKASDESWQCPTCKRGVPRSETACLWCGPIIAQNGGDDPCK